MEVVRAIVKEWVGVCVVSCVGGCGYECEWRGEKRVGESDGEIQARVRDRRARASHATMPTREETRGDALA